MSTSYDMRVIGLLTDLCIACSWFAFHSIFSLISLVALQEYNVPADKYMEFEGRKLALAGEGRSINRGGVRHIWVRVRPLQVHVT